MSERIKLIYFTLLLGIIGFYCILLFVYSKPIFPLRVGVKQWPGYETLYLSRSLNYLDSSTVKLVDLPSSTDVIHAFRNETLEAATLTLDETLTLASTGINLKVVAVMAMSAGANILLANSQYQSIAQLKGKKIGIDNNAVSAVLLNEAFEHSNMTSSDFIVVPVSEKKQISAFLNHEIEALVTAEPIKSQLIAQGANPLFDSSQIPGRIVDVLVVRSDIMKTRLYDVCQFVKKQFKASDFFNQHAKKAVQLMAPRLQTDPEQLLITYQNIRLPSLQDNWSLMNGETYNLKTSALQLSKVMLRQGLLNSIPNTEKIFDNRCIPDKVR